MISLQRCKITIFLIELKQKKREPNLKLYIIPRQFKRYNSKKKKEIQIPANSTMKTDQTSSSGTISCPNTTTLISQHDLQSRFNPSSPSPSPPSHNFERNHVRARLSRSLIRSVKHKRDHYYRKSLHTVRQYVHQPADIPVGLENMQTHVKRMKSSARDPPSLREKERFRVAAIFHLKN